MSGAAAGAAGAAAAAAIAQAIKASGVLVRVEPAAFYAVLDSMQAPLIVAAQGGIFRTRYQYLTSYKGLAFLTSSNDPLQLPPTAELIEAKSFSMPA